MSALVAGERPRTRRTHPRTAALVLRGVATMLVTSLLAGAAFATEDALPDSPLHDVKIATEQARLALARSSATLIAVELDIADARLQEAAALQAQNREAEAEAAVSAYGEHLASAAAHLEETNPAPQAAQVAQFRVMVMEQLQKSARVADPPVSGGALNTALSIASEIGTTIRRDDRVGASEIATAAASAAAKAATSVEQRAPAAPERAPTAEVRVPSVTSEPQVATSKTPASTAKPAVPVSAANLGGAPEPASSPIVQTTPPVAPNQTAQNEKQKLDTAAKAAREAADRAQQAADRAKQAAEKTKKEKGKESPPKK